MSPVQAANDVTYAADRHPEYIAELLYGLEPFGMTYPDETYVALCQLSTNVGFTLNSSRAVLPGSFAEFTIPMSLS
jgi:hypothetical protein